MLANRIARLIGFGHYNSSAAYERHLKSKLRLHSTDRELAFANAVGSETVRWYRKQGNAQVAVLKHHGLRDGMAIYDLGCGCGRTAQALMRQGWSGRYIGADIVEDFVSELRRLCPQYEAHLHRQPTIVAADDSLDMLFHWSVFTHIAPEECFLYLEDAYRALKPGGQLVFSFLEMTDDNHWSVFDSRVERLRTGKKLNLLDTFLSRDWIEAWADRIGYERLSFTDGQSTEHHPKMWQTIAAMMRPAR
jgi:SAM-dependent methyltransferase